MNLKKVLSMASLGFTVLSGQTPFRPPAVPLVAVDPYFSIWSMQDRLTDEPTKHWTGANQGFCGLVRIDGRTRRFIGAAPKETPVLPQTSLQVMPTQTRYEFTGEGVQLTLTFTTPLLPDDLNLLSRPITFITMQICAIDGREHDVQLYFDTTMEPTVNDRKQKVVWSRLQTRELAVLSAGSQEQPVLQKSGDNLRMDWGYYYLAAELAMKPNSCIQKAALCRSTFDRLGELPAADDMDMPRTIQEDAPVMAMQFSLGRVAGLIRQRYVILAYDDQFSIEYFQRKLQPYWRRNGAKAADLLENGCSNYPHILNRCDAFDRSLYSDLLAAGGREYAQLASLAYRQALAAQKLAVDIDGRPLLFPKENFSNGCISTVDVIYPAAPQLLLFNLELMKASVRPVLEYASLTRWKFPFAPHDLGTYPKANGQIYGGGELTEENQMPVEESGNMLLLLAAIAQMEGKADFSVPYWPVVQKWAHYLKEKGFDPENQLCTDDFAGHLAHNVNLSLKAILAMAAYSRLCDMRDLKPEAAVFRKLTREYAQKWMTMAQTGDHYRLAFDKPETWSQKYNLVWDKILNLDVFPKEVAQKEIRWYLQKQNRYGLPLDSRKDYTKLDWTIWTATLAESQDDFEALVKPVYQFAHETTSRVPLSDWYGTTDGKMVGFQARSVVGGVFIKMLADPALWNKWVKK